MGIYPLWESRATISHVTRAIIGDVTGKRRATVVTQGRTDTGDQLSPGQTTPVGGAGMTMKEAAVGVEDKEPVRKENA